MIRCVVIELCQFDMKMLCYTSGSSIEIESGQKEKERFEGSWKNCCI
jgi:hypothetical protein